VKPKKYSDIAIKLLAVREYKSIKTNAQFWKEFFERRQLDEISENDDIRDLQDDLINDLESYGYGIVCIYDDDFPVINRRVKNNGDKPYLLFYKGNLSLLNNLNKNVSVVGLRDPDEEIKRRETKIVRKLIDNESKNNEPVIVSGLALGCDTIAHKVCLENSGKTIAILPTLNNKSASAESRQLAEEIVDKGGLLLSEYYKETTNRNVYVKQLIERDRLQAMFAKAIILIASYRNGEGDSGSRHAMEAAKKYGIERYIMYNSKTDKDNKQFGLNNDFVTSNDNIKLLTSQAIKDIDLLDNPDLKKDYNNRGVQQTFEY
jgi:DNA processing protein